IKHPMDLGSMTKKLKGLAYKSKQDFYDATMTNLNNGVPTGPLVLQPHNVIGGGESTDWCTVKMKVYDMRYCACCRWEGEMIVQVRAYIDTDLLQRAVTGASKDVR
ncbi:Transcriptional activator spt7, partial [Elasticomyces elasticus]